VSVFSSFDELPPSCVRLFDKWSQQGYDYSLPWFRNFVRGALDPGDEVCIYAVERANGAGSAVAALPMRCRKQAKRRFAPEALSALSNYYTISFGPLWDSSGSDLPEAFDALAHAISTDSRRWDMVELRPLDPHSIAFTQLVKSFQSAGLVVQTYFCFGNWYLTVNGKSYAEYCDMLPSAMRNTLRRKTKKLEKSGRAQIEVSAGGADLERAIAAYEQVYLASWKVPEPYPRFVPGLIRTCAERGWLRQGTVYFDEQPIAAQIWIVHAGRATIYKLAHDQRFDELSAGSILTARLLQHVLDVDRVQEVDFGSGDDPYKKNWLPQRRERWGIIAFNPKTVSGCFCILRHIVGHSVKSSLKRLVGKRPQRPAPHARPSGVLESRGEPTGTDGE
jgi:hypothetical protein